MLLKLSYGSKDTNKTTGVPIFVLLFTIFIILEEELFNLYVPQFLHVCYADNYQSMYVRCFERVALRSHLSVSC